MIILFRHVILFLLITIVTTSGIAQQNQLHKAFLEYNIHGARPQPENIPTLDEVNSGKAQYSDRYYSAKEATRLGIPVVNATATRDYLVIVRDYKRWKTCPAADGKGTLEYGQVIRAVIEVLSYDASMTLDLASIAAQGTINRRRQYFYLYKDGISNPAIDEIIAAVSGKVFDVENYALYQNIMPQLIKLFSDPKTQLSVNLIGIIPPVDDPDFLYAPVRAYALCQIAKGITLVEAQKRFAASEHDKLASILSTYQFIMDEDYASVPSAEHKERAKKILGDLKIK